MTLDTGARMTQDLLIEIGTEELPPVSLQGLAKGFADGINNQLTENGIGHGPITSYCTPRRLAVLVAQVETQQAQRTTTRRGPAVTAAFGPEGQPTKALEGFARSCGVAISDLAREQSDKGEWVVFRRLESGQCTARLLPRILEQALAGLPVARRMRWGTGDAEFVRPVHWICIVLGDEAVPAQVLGVHAGTKTFGHRFHAPGPLTVTHASLYPRLLREQGFVEPCFEQRRALIVAQIQQLTATHRVTADLPAALLDEVTGLVEWPIAIFGSFDESFLSVPPEVLIETMEKNQKYFPVRDINGRLQARFIAVSNIESKCPEQVIQGNERVIRPRFADAQFFWRQGLNQPLAANFERLESIVFQDKLGSVADRCRRVAALAGSIAVTIGEDPASVERAAMLAKCDLATAMVTEFPSLQGIMGRYYAEHAGELPAVCAAIEEQYLPRHAGDALPARGAGLVLALADRLDLLVGSFGIGHRPTGAKDPYGLRRASIAVVRILVETPLNLDLNSLVLASERSFESGVLSPGTTDEVLVYIMGRLEGYYQERGVLPDSVASVIAAGGATLSQLDRRIRAVQSFRNRPETLALAGANKRISNILAKAQVSFDRGARPNPDLFTDDAEHQLWNRIEGLELVTAPLMRECDFAGILEQLAQLRDDVGRFFDQVMVMCEDRSVQDNRLLLLTRLQALFLQVADISMLQIAYTQFIEQ